MPTMKGGATFRAVLSKMAAKLSQPGTVRIGFLENSTFPDGTSIPMVAAIQEFGAPRAHIPPRPFFRTMIAEKSPEWPDAIAGLLKSTNYDVNRTLAMMGEGIAGQLRESIIKLQAPPLSPVTVMLRGMQLHDPKLVVTKSTVAEARRRVALGLTNYGASDKPLIHHGDMLNAVAYEVKTTATQTGAHVP